MEYYPDSNIYRYEHSNFLGRFGGFNILSIVNKDFEIVQKQDKIDIDSIIKLEEFELDQFVIMDNSERFDRTMIEYSKINQLVQAVKQLNKEVKELENKIN